MKFSSLWRAEPLKKDTDLSKIKLLKRKCKYHKCKATWKATKNAVNEYCSQFCTENDGAETARWFGRI